MLDRGPILVPLDGSEVAEKVLPYATTIAAALHTHLVLITVWEGANVELGSTFPSIATEIERNAQQHYTDYLDGIRHRLGDTGIRTIVRSGEAGEEILKAANETDARMVALATHGRSGIGRWLYGSTAGHVLRHSATPVLAVGPHAPERPSRGTSFKHIMVPLDGRPPPEIALAVAQNLGAQLGATLSIVRVVNWAAHSYPFALPDAYAPQLDDDLAAGAKAYLQKQQQRARSDGTADHTVEAFVVRGATADGLIDFVEKQSIDLIVMTTHARTGIARAALGSVADRMLQATAPVLLIRPDDA